MTAATDLIKLLFAYYIEVYPLPDALYEHSFDSQPPKLPTLAAKFIIYCDNKGLLKQLKSYSSPLIFRTSVLKPEWDLTQRAFETLKTFATKPELKWIKGHQDDKEKNSRLPNKPIPPSTVQCNACACTLLNDTEIRQQHQSPYCHSVSLAPAPTIALPLESRLNILADEKATYFIERPYPRHTMQAPHDPTTHISILYKGATITGDYRKHICEQVFDPYHYNHKRYKWDHETYESIDWASFGSVFSK